MDLFHGIRVKVAKLLPLLDEIIQDHLRFKHACESNPPIKAVHLVHRLRSDLSLRITASVRFQLQRLVQDSEKHSRIAILVETEIQSPDLPGVARDPIELRKILRRKLGGTASQ